VFQTPVASDYIFGNMEQTAGSVTAVSITADTDKSPGSIHSIRYNGSSIIPQAAGTYAVTFDVYSVFLEGTFWSGATNLSAGDLVVNPVPPILVPGYTLTEKLTWLQTNAESYRSYIVEINFDESINLVNLTYSGRNNIDITFTGIGENRTISRLSGMGLLSIGNGVTLILDSNVTLHTSNGYSAVRVYTGGTFIMNEGSKITGNIFSSPSENIRGGGVYVDGGTFNMTGGEISGNSLSSVSGSVAGGGVYMNGGTFTMTNGKIINNSGGGGVYMNGGTFTMTNGKIINNSGGGGVFVENGTFIMTPANGEISGNTGGGVSINRGTFTMEGGKISDNEGIGVSVRGFDNTTTFRMTDGLITNNTATLNGAGVSLSGSRSVFIMEDGTISYNTNTGSGSQGSASSGDGGGVSVSYGSFTMTGGIITGNTATNNGGGVHTYFGSFTMTGGYITGNTANNNGGGVSGTVTSMENGEISGNYAANGGGVSGSIKLISGLISGNTATNNGGGVSGTVSSMEGGTISGNTAANNGGGIHGTVTSMTNGIISGNIATNSGGGIYLSSSAPFTKTGGIIYGFNGDDNSNYAQGGDNLGHAVYINTSPEKRRETTAGTEVNLYTSVPGAPGGWED